MKRSYKGKEILAVKEETCFELKYYILEEEIELENCKHIGYGIEIIKQDNSRIEKSQIMDITTDQTRIDYIVKVLMKNNVTPIHLHDVIENML